MNLRWFWFSLTSLVAQRVKRLPEMWETWVQSLGQEDLLEKEMASHSSVLSWKIPWTEEPGGLQSVASQSQTWLKQLRTHAHTRAVRQVFPCFSPDLWCFAYILWCLLVYGCLTITSAFIFTWCCLYMYVSASRFTLFRRTMVILDQSTTLLQYHDILTITSQMILFSNKVTHQGIGLRTSTLLLAGT